MVTGSGSSPTKGRFTASLHLILSIALWWLWLVVITVGHLFEQDAPEVWFETFRRWKKFDVVSGSLTQNAAIGQPLNMILSFYTFNDTLWDRWTFTDKEKEPFCEELTSAFVVIKNISISISKDLLTLLLNVCSMKSLGEKKKKNGRVHIG